MKIISWNVAGMRACIKKGFPKFFEEENADIFCLQEIKALKDEIPFSPSNYFTFINSADKRGYSGTLVYTKKKPISVRYDLEDDMHNHEGRIIILEYNAFFLINVYVPNVKRNLSRMSYRMQWEDAFFNHVKKLENKKPVIICGDFNVAHENIDIRNYKQNVGNAGFTKEEREKFSCLLDSGFIDTYRAIFPLEEKYTWWSYMPGVRERNIGWRIDYFLVSQNLFSAIKSARIYDSVLGSDHCPIGIDIQD